MANTILALRAVRRLATRARDPQAFSVDQTDAAEEGEPSYSLSSIPYADEIRGFLDEKAGSALSHRWLYDESPSQNRAIYVTVTGPGETCLVVLGDITREQAEAIEALLTEEQSPARNMPKMTSLPVFQECVKAVLGEWIAAKWYRMLYW